MKTAGIFAAERLSLRAFTMWAGVLPLSLESLILYF